MYKSLLKEIEKVSLNIQTAIVRCGKDVKRIRSSLFEDDRDILKPCLKFKNIINVDTSKINRHDSIMHPANLSKVKQQCLSQLNQTQNIKRMPNFTEIDADTRARIKQIYK